MRGTKNGKTTMRTEKKGSSKRWILISLSALALVIVITWQLMPSHLIRYVKVWATGSERRPDFVLPQKQADTYYLEFIAVGDTENGEEGQKNVAHAMETYAMENPVAFVFMLGDNFSSAGVTSVDDPLWQQRFEQMYDPSILDMPFYAIEGNHDEKGNIEAEIDYSALSSRWNVPGLYYTLNRALPDGTTVEIIALDTSTILEDSTQRQWFKETLASSNADWKIVCGHHPLYSHGIHGGSKGLRDLLEPAMIDAGVNLYLCGHDHDLQILGPTNGIYYIVDGAGSEALPTRVGSDTIYAARMRGFMAFRICQNNIVIMAVNENAEIDYALTINKDTKYE